MLDILKSIIPVIVTLVSVSVGAFLTYRVACRMEQHKESRTRQTIAIVLQAELIRLHMKIKEHNDSLAAYAEKFSKEINSQEALKYNPISVDNDFIIYKSSIKDISLFEKDTAYQIVYCYGNVLDFIKSQDKFLRDLPGIANSSRVGWARGEEP